MKICQSLYCTLSNLPIKSTCLFPAIYLHSGTLIVFDSAWLHFDAKRSIFFSFMQHHFFDNLISSCALEFCNEMTKSCCRVQLRARVGAARPRCDCCAVPCSLFCCWMSQLWLRGAKSHHGQRRLMNVIQSTEAEEEPDEINCEGALFSSLKEHALRLGETSRSERWWR